MINSKLTKQEQNNYINNLTKDDIVNLLNGTEDVIMKDITANNSDITYTIIYCIGLCDTERIDKEIIPELEYVLNNKTAEQLKNEQLTHLLAKRVLKTCTSEADFTTNIFSGQLGIYIEDKNNTTYMLDLANHPKRTPDEPNTEISIRGPKDGFIEDLETNIALIRKRLKTNSLIYKEFKIGKRTNTKVGLFYINDIAKKDVIEEVVDRLNDVDINGLHNASQLEELLARKKFFLFPIFQYSG